VYGIQRSHARRHPCTASHNDGTMQSPCTLNRSETMTTYVRYNPKQDRKSEERNAMQEEPATTSNHIRHCQNRHLKPGPTCIVQLSPEPGPSVAKKNARRKAFPRTDVTGVANPKTPKTSGGCGSGKQPTGAPPRPRKDAKKTPPRLETTVFMSIVCASCLKSDVRGKIRGN
jgi:hypothetical protein